MTKTTIRLAAGVAVAALLAGVAVAQPAAAPETPRPSNDPAEFLRDPPKPASPKGRFSLVLLGDLLYSRPMAERPDPKLQEVISLIRSGDVTIANRESPILDLETFQGTGYANGLLWGEASLAKDQKAMGIDMVSMANNHSTDWGPEGVIETIRLHDEAGIVHSGAGRNLQEARRAGILTTPKARVALVSTASTVKPNAGANDAFGEVKQRTGISVLRVRPIQMVTADQMALVRKMATEFASPRKPAPAADAVEVTVNEQIYRLGPKTELKWEMDLYDHAGLLKAVREAKDNADVVVFTIHAHESTTGVDDDTPPPPDFLIRLFHDAVDVGADVILGGGPTRCAASRSTRARSSSTGWASSSSTARSRRCRRPRCGSGPIRRPARRRRPDPRSARCAPAAIPRAGTTAWLRSPSSTDRRSGR